MSYLFSAVSSKAKYLSCNIVSRPDISTQASTIHRSMWELITMLVVFALTVLRIIFKVNRASGSRIESFLVIPHIPVLTKPVTITPLVLSMTTMGKLSLLIISITVSHVLLKLAGYECCNLSYGMGA